MMQSGKKLFEHRPSGAAIATPGKSCTWYPDRCRSGHSLCPEPRHGYPARYGRTVCLVGLNMAAFDVGQTIHFWVVDCNPMTEGMTVGPAAQGADFGALEVANFGIGVGSNQTTSSVQARIAAGRNMVTNAALDAISINCCLLTVMGCLLNTRAIPIPATSATPTAL